MIKLLIIVVLLFWVGIRFKSTLAKAWLAFVVPFLSKVNKAAEKVVVKGPELDRPLSEEQVREVRK